MKSTDLQLLEALERMRGIQSPRDVRVKALLGIKRDGSFITRELIDEVTKFKKDVAINLADFESILIVLLEEIKILRSLEVVDGVNGKDGAAGVTPIKGVDYFTQEEVNEFTKKIESQITIPKPERPLPGVDYPTHEQVTKLVKEHIKKIKLPKEQKPLVKGIDYFTDSDVAKIAKEASMEGKDIVKEINRLPIHDPAKKIDAVHIKNLPQMIRRERKKETRSNSVTFTTVTPTGSINGSNTSFTVPSHNFGLLFLNGAFQTPGGEDYTMTSDTAFTTVLPPPSGSVFRFLYA